jgi:Na+-driven multidrug efflux pump
VALISNVLFNYLLIPTHGIIGAAMATALSYTTGLVLLLGLFLWESGIPLRDLLIPRRDDFLYAVGVLRNVVKRIPGAASLLPLG